MKTVERKCEWCEKTFYPLAKEVNRGQARFCSRTCSSSRPNLKRRQKKVAVQCSWCSKNFEMNKGRMVAKHGHYFCTRLCKDTAQRIGGLTAIQPKHYTEESKNYRLKAMRLLPNHCANCGYKTHIDVLQVHHIDENRNNNDISNLMILCPTCHVAHHKGHW